MCSNDLSRLVHKYPNPNSNPLKHLSWVSDKAVVAYWDSLVLIPLSGGAFELYYSEPLHLVAEMDGVRILSLDKNELLQVVPKPLSDVFQIAVLEVSSILYESSLAFYESRNQRAEEYIRVIKEKGSLDEVNRLNQLCFSISMLK